MLYFDRYDTEVKNMSGSRTGMTTKITWLTTLSVKVFYWLLKDQFKILYLIITVHRDSRILFILGLLIAKGNKQIGSTIATHFVAFTHSYNWFVFSLVFNLISNSPLSTPVWICQSRRVNCQLYPAVNFKT